MVGAFQTYPITISRIQVIFIAIRIQVIFTSNKCIDDASPCSNDVDYDIEGGRYYDRIPVVLPGRDDCVIYSDTGGLVHSLSYASGGWGAHTVTLWWPNGSVAKAEPVTKCHSVWTPRHTYVTHNVTQCWDSKTHLSHIPTHTVTNIGRPPTQLVPWDWYIDC